jgi:hypothetical protein
MNSEKQTLQRRRGPLSPRDVPSSEANGFTVGEGQGEGAEKHGNSPLTLTLCPPPEQRPTELIPPAGGEGTNRNPPRNKTELPPTTLIAAAH